MLENPRSRHRLGLVLVLVLASAYLGARADLGWVAHDEGYLGHSAERVLRGELPHRDFDDVYTGLLALFHAEVFRWFGVDLLNLRYALLGCALAGVAAVYAIAARFTSPAAAVLTTLLALAWSLPIYFASLSSWYVSFSALFGTLALLRHLDAGERRWLFAAGVCGAVAVLVKVSGLFYVAGVLLFLLRREHAQPVAADATRTAGTSRAYAVFLASGLALFCAALLLLVSRWPGPLQYLHFVFPALALGTLLVWRELRAPRPLPFATRLQALWRLSGPFLAGLGLPIAAFLVPYVRSDALGALWHGVFVLPQKRFDYATQVAPSEWQLVAAAPLALVLLAQLGALASQARFPFPRALGERAWAWQVGLIGALALWVLPHGQEELTWQAIWNSAFPLVPLTTGVGTLALAAARGGQAASRRGEEVFALLAVSACFSVVQFPYNSEIYFAYVAPLAVLAFLAVQGLFPDRPRRLYAALAAFYFLFAVVCVHRSWGAGFEPAGLRRASLRLPPGQAAAYRQVVELVQRHSAPGSFILATPDSPEIYFLADRANPTRTFYDFFDADDSPESRWQRLFALLRERDVNVVVVKRQVFFSPPVERRFLQALALRYQVVEGNAFFWVLRRSAR
ncbi:MAG: ArnT family glycosyltransferase [Vicinamibacteria bacterium]